MLETALERSGADRVKEQGIYRQKLAALTRNLGQAMRERDICRIDRETELCKRVMEIEKNYAGILNAKQVEFDLKFEELRNKFEAENLTVKLLKYKLILLNKIIFFRRLKSRNSLKLRSRNPPPSAINYAKCNLNT